MGQPPPIMGQGPMNAPISQPPDSGEIALEPLNSQMPHPMNIEYSRPQTTFQQPQYPCKNYCNQMFTKFEKLRYGCTCTNINDVNRATTNDANK
jgi:hypothetical protein